MTEGAALGAFVLVSLVLLLTPGPAVAFVLTRSLAGGSRAGIISQAGLCAGLLVHVAATSLGLSALLVQSAGSLSLLRLLGAAYLLWLAIAAFRSREPLLQSRPSKGGPSPGRLFLDGFILDVVNPKPALFFLAFLPQFVEPGAAATAQILALGGLFVVLAFLTGSLYAALAGLAAPHLNGSRSLRRSLQWGSGLTYLALAAAAAGSSR